MIETMIGNSIANQCSPVLMDVKPSNLLILTREEEEGFLEMEDIPGIWGICLHRGEQKKHLAFVPEGQTGSIAFLAGDSRISEILWLSDRRMYT